MHRLRRSVRSVAAGNFADRCDENAGGGAEFAELAREFNRMAGELDDFYKRLESGVGRSEALRQVQLKMLKTADHNHPYFWAAFILSGDWRKLN